jgi:MFS family permease
MCVVCRRCGQEWRSFPSRSTSSSTLANTKLLPRFGPRRLIIAGFASSAVGFALLTQLDPGSAYFAHVFPSLVLIGLGIGFSFPPATNIATRGVEFKDAGVASAMVNTMQQIGGSVGIALLSAFAAQSTNRYLSSHNHNGNPADLARSAATHGYTVAFAISTAVLIAAGILCGALIPKHVVQGSQAAPAQSTGAVNARQP